MGTPDPDQLSRQATNKQEQNTARSSSTDTLSVTMSGKNNNINGHINTSLAPIWVDNLKKAKLKSAISMSNSTHLDNPSLRRRSVDASTVANQHLGSHTHHSHLFNRLKSPSENKVTFPEISGIIQNPENNLSYLNPPSSMPSSPLAVSPGTFSRRNLLGDGANTPITSSTSQHALTNHGKSSTTSSTKGSEHGSARSSSTVVETRHISLEYDPVKKRKMLNTYEILSDLGSGQHGKVKLALDTVTGEKVAIKILDRTGRAKVGANRYYYASKHDLHEGQNSATDPSTPDDVGYMSENEFKIRKEIAIMKKCDHENIVKLREVIDDHRLRKIYLVLEYLEKGEIDWQIEDTKAITKENDEQEIITTFKPVLSFKEARKVFKDVVLGLEYLHYQGIIHRDIKPANLLISQNNTVKISDFGVSFSISFLENSEYDLCKTAGTPAFYAPELVSTDSKVSYGDESHPRISHKVDIWALGVTLYCLMFGKLPFYGQNNFELFDKINKTDIELPTFQDFLNYEILQNEYITETQYDEMKDLLKRLLDKDPYRRIDIPEIKQHPFVISSLETEEDKHKFYNNLLLSNADFESTTSINRKLSNSSAMSVTGKIDVSSEEMGNAITDIGNKLKSSLSRVLNFTGLSSSSTLSLMSKKSTSPNSPGSVPPSHHHQNQNHHKHRLSISSVFSKKNDSQSQTNSTVSSRKNSRKNSRSNTVYTPPHVHTLTHEGSSSSLRSAPYSFNSENSFGDAEYKKAQHPPQDGNASLYIHGNSTGSSFLSPSINNSELMSQNQEYFHANKGAGSDKRVHNCNTVTNSNEFPLLAAKSRSGSQLSLRSKNSVLHPHKQPASLSSTSAYPHKRTFSNNSAQLSDTCIEGGFFVHTKPVANTLNGIIERSNRSSTHLSHPQDTEKVSPVTPPSGKGPQSPSIFGLGSKLRNSSFLNGYNNGITLPRKSSNVSLPVNSSYASLNSVNDNFIYSSVNNNNSNSNNDMASGSRMVGYSTPGYQNNASTNQTVNSTYNNDPSASTLNKNNNFSGLLNNKNNNSGFLASINNDASKFKFHEDSIKEKIYGRKNKDTIRLDNYSDRKSMAEPLVRSNANRDSDFMSPVTVTPTKEEFSYGASKTPSVSTINETQSSKNLVSNFEVPRRYSASLSFGASDSESDTDGGILQFNPSNYSDRTGLHFFPRQNGRSSRDDVEATNSANQCDLKPVDSVVTVPNSLLSKLNSADVSKQPSQSQLFNLYTGSLSRGSVSRGSVSQSVSDANSNNNNSNNNNNYLKDLKSNNNSNTTTTTASNNNNSNNNSMNFKKPGGPTSFKFGADDDDETDEDSGEESSSPMFFADPEILKKKLASLKHYQKYNDRYGGNGKSNSNSNIGSNSPSSLTSLKSSGDESDGNSQELTFNFASRKLASERKKSIT